MARRDVVVAFAIAGAGLAAAEPAAAATYCVNPLGGACQTTIQGAVDAAGPGDVVSIQAGTYYENVEVPAGKDGLQIVGASKLAVVVDPAPYADLGRTSTDAALFVMARNVTVKNLTVRNAIDGGIVATGRGVLVQGVKVVGLSGTGISVSGWYSQVLLSEIQGTLTGIASTGYGTVVRGNTVAGPYYGIQVQADGNQVLSNKVYDGLQGVSAVGDGTVVKGNDVRRQTDAGITVMGRSPVVDGNTVEGSKQGIVATCVDCFSGSVSANKLTGLSDHAVLASADGLGLLVQGNQVSKTGAGVSLNGVGINARLNKVSDVGLDWLEACFAVFGSGHTLAQNTATSCASEGIFVKAADVTLDRNVTTGTFQNGIFVDGDDGAGGSYSGLVLEGNKSSGSALNGILVSSALGTVVRNNVATKNRTDFCNEATDTALFGNTFTTVQDVPGTPCPLIRE
jgi:hypothetical protein